MVEKVGEILSYAANGPTTKYTFGKITSNNPVTIGPCTVAGESADVVIRNTMDTAGDPVGGMLGGDSFVIAGATITTVAGKLAVTTDNQGCCIPAATGNKINGYALNDGVLGDLIRVRFQGGMTKSVAP